MGDDLKMSKLVRDAEVAAVVERLRLHGDRPLQIEISCADAREGEVAHFMNAVIEDIKSSSGHGLIRLRSPGGDDLGHLEIRAEHLTGTSVDSSGIGLEYGTTFVKLWDQLQMWPYGWPEQPLGVIPGAQRDGGKRVEVAGSPFEAVVQHLWRLVDATVFIDYINDADETRWTVVMPTAKIVGVETLGKDSHRQGRGVRVDFDSKVPGHSFLGIREKEVVSAEHEDGCLTISFGDSAIRIFDPDGGVRPTLPDPEF